LNIKSNLSHANTPSKILHHFELFHTSEALVCSLQRISLQYRLGG
jgi:hypothetical protein